MSQGNPALGAEPVARLLARVEEIEEQLRAIPIATDEKALKELRRTIEALSKRDPKFEEKVTERVDVVADRLEMLAKTISTTSAAIAARDGEIAQLRRALDSATVRVDEAVADLRRGQDPGALTDIKRTLAALSQQKLPKGLEGQIRDLGAKLALLSQRVDTLSSTLSTTAAGLAGRDGDVTALRRAHEADTARIDSELADVRRAVDHTAVDELRQAVEQLRAVIADQRHTSERLLDDLSSQTDGVVARLEALGASVGGTVTRVTEAEKEISAIREAVERDVGQHVALVAELNESVAALSARIAELEQDDGEAARALDERVSAVGADVRGVVVRLDALETTVASTSERLGDRDDDLAAVERRFQGASARVDSLVEDLMRALEDFPDADALQRAHRSDVDELAARLDEVERSVSEQSRKSSSDTVELERQLVSERAKGAELTDRLEALATRASALELGHGELGSQLAETAQRLDAVGLEASGEASRAAQQATEELARLIADVSTRLETVEEGRDGTSAEIARLAAILEVERASVRARLDGLTEAQERVAGAPDSSELERQLSALATRFDSLEGRLEATAADQGRVAAAFNIERASVQAQLEALAGALSIPAHTLPADVEERLDELTRKLAAVEKQSAAVASEMSRATTLWPAALRSLEGRLDEIGPRALGTDGGGESSHRLPSLPVNDSLEDDPPGAESEPADHAEVEDSRDDSLERGTARIGLQVVPLRAADP